jgi:hypothetical protein
MPMKNSNDTIEPATFRFVAQWLNQLRHRGQSHISRMKHALHDQYTPLPPTRGKIHDVTEKENRILCVVINECCYNRVVWR